MGLPGRTAAPARPPKPPPQLIGKYTIHGVFGFCLFVFRSGDRSWKTPTRTIQGVPATLLMNLYWTPLGWSRYIKMIKDELSCYNRCWVASQLRESTMLNMSSFLSCCPLIGTKTLLVGASGIATRSKDVLRRRQAERFPSGSPLTCA